jgi:hypothetical protein
MTSSLSSRNNHNNHPKRNRTSVPCGAATGGLDLIWIQWTLQYLTDTDVITTLQTLATWLTAHTGYLIIKENRPYGTARSDRFQMDTPCGPQERYDITRSDAHHRLLFYYAGLQVHYTEQGTETNTYAVQRQK